MRAIPQLEITEARLTSSTVFETAPAAWNSGTTYTAGDYASTAGANGLITCYRALDPDSPPVGNLNHITSDTNWWEDVGETYQVYSGGSTYALAEYVIDTTTHFVFKSVKAGNVGNTLPATSVLDDAWWLPIQPTNKWAMFNLLRNTRTVVPSTLTVVITPGQRVDSFDVSDMVNVSTLHLTMVSGATTVYDYTDDLNERDVFDWYDYFFAPFSTAPSSVHFDLPPYSNGVITLTLTSTSGNVEVGSFVVGTQVYVGKAAYSATRDFLNFSTVKREFDGRIAELVQRKGIPRTRQIIKVEKNRVRLVSELLLTLDATPATWSALDDENDVYFNPLHIIGFVKSGSINIDFPDYALLTLELESVT